MPVCPGMLGRVLEVGTCCPLRLRALLHEVVYRAAPLCSSAPPASAVGVLTFERRCSGDRGLLGWAGPKSPLPAAPKSAQ